jgi:polysaccharide export outer membrane protein
MKYVKANGSDYPRVALIWPFTQQVLRLLPFVFMIFMVGGCSTLYRSAKVLEGDAGGAGVRVVGLSALTVARANASTYQPKTQPAAFSLTAGTGGTGFSGAGALPRGPVTAPNPPKRLELRMPPAISFGPYTIGIGDVVLLSTPSGGSTVQELPGLLTAQNARHGYTVQDDGSVNIPKVGRIKIAGETIKDAEASLFKKFVENNIEPTFSLEITEFNSRKISVGGAVERPVIVPVALTPIYLDEALAAAGGIVATDQSEAAVRLYRQGTLYQIPLSHLYAHRGDTKLRLKDGDTIFVDTGYDLGRAQEFFEQQLLLVEAKQEARQIALEELQAEVALRRANLNETRDNHIKRIELGSDNRDYVYLTGEVGVQSRFALPFDVHAKLADALFDAGGIAAATGDVSQIYVLRVPKGQNPSGGITAWHLDASNAANFVYATSFELRPNDIIFVAEQPITRWDRTVSQLVPNFYSASSNVGN